MNQNDENLEEKKLLGSGGHAFAKLTEQEELKASVGVPQFSLGMWEGYLKKDLQNIIAINAKKNTVALQQ